MAEFGTAVKIDTRPQVENRLIFEFPSTQGGVMTTRTLPFFENPKIMESQQANLVTYNVLGRPGNFFGYTGAKSRAYQLEFFLTLPHIVNTAAAELFSNPPAPLSRNQKQKAFFDKKHEVGNRNRESPLVLTYEKDRKELLNMINDNAPLPKYRGNIADFVTDTIEFADNNTAESKLATNLNAYRKPFIYAQAVQMVLFWIKLIRVSVLNNQRHPTFGPPIIRVKMGELYDYISCLATKYSLSWDEAAGFDVVTYLPNRIKVTLSLVQIQRNPGIDWSYNDKVIMDVYDRSEEVLSGWEDFEGSESWADWLKKEAPAFSSALTGPPGSPASVL